MNMQVCLNNQANTRFLIYDVKGLCFKAQSYTLIMDVELPGRIYDYRFERFKVFKPPALPEVSDFFDPELYR
jgi:hypothetical protein